MLKVILLLSLVAFAASRLVGGFEKVDVNDDGVVEAANHAAQALSEEFSSKYHHKLVKVTKAEQQVVAGLNYRMNVVVGLTTCKKSEVEYENLGDCDLQEGVSTYKKCEVVVYRDLSNNHKLTHSGCLLASRNEV